LPVASPGQFGHNGSCRATGTENNHALVPRIDTGVGAHASQETLAIGVLADETVSHPPDRIHCADDGGVRRDLVKIFNNCDLVRNRKVDALHAERTHSQDRVTQVGGRHFHCEVSPV
jgi:hypothetical protein